MLEPEGCRPLTLLADCLVLAIRLCRNEVDLAYWWGEHSHILRSLDEAAWAEVWAAKAEMEERWVREMERRQRQREPQARFF